MLQPSSAVTWLLAFSALTDVLAMTQTPTNYAVHEKRKATHHKAWKRGSIADADAIIPLRIGLKQSGLDRGYERLMEVSHPSSEKYGQHLSAAEVHSMFAPAEETTAAIKEWLVASGIKKSAIMEYENKGWLAVDLPVSRVERLFKTRYYEYASTGSTYRLGCDKYSVPAHLSDHIDYISPGLMLSPPMKKRSVVRRSRTPQPRGSKTRHATKRAINAVQQMPVNTTCATIFSVDCYRKLYNIPANVTALHGNTVGIFEYGDVYAQEDLDLYFSYFTPEVPNGTHPNAALINGAKAPVNVTSPSNMGESAVDLAILQPLVYPQNVTLYQTDDLYYTTNGSYGAFNSFLDALDGSYCNRTAFGISGDDPVFDPHYPNNNTDGYAGERQCGVYQPARVISISYGGYETSNPTIRYAQRQCSEFMKLALQGHTFLVSSGDFGVAGIGSSKDPSSGCRSAAEVNLETPNYSSSSSNTTVFYSGWPADCPFVTSVGATMLQKRQKETDPESAMQLTLDKGPSKASFSSTGGFSNFFPTPPWQKETINRYFESYDPGYPYYYSNKNGSNIGDKGGYYNRGGRGFPDVSANGYNFALYVQGELQLAQGSSLSAPLWAAVVTLINQERQAIGKGPVGFINPVLYAHPEAMTDITNGSNPNCGTDGFKAVAGWDPVTGLGTPNYPKLLKLFKSLP